MFSSARKSPLKDLRTHAEVATARNDDDRLRLRHFPNNLTRPNFAARGALAAKPAAQWADGPASTDQNQHIISNTAVSNHVSRSAWNAQAFIPCRLICVMSAPFKSVKKIANYVDRLCRRDNKKKGRKWISKFCKQRGESGHIDWSIACNFSLLPKKQPGVMKWLFGSERSFWLKPFIWSWGHSFQKDPPSDKFSKSSCPQRFSFNVLKKSMFTAWSPRFLLTHCGGECDDGSALSPSLTPFFFIYHDNCMLSTDPENAAQAVAIKTRHQKEEGGGGR